MHYNPANRVKAVSDGARRSAGGDRAGFFLALIALVLRAGRHRTPG